MFEATRTSGVTCSMHLTRPHTCLQAAVVVALLLGPCAAMAQASPAPPHADSAAVATTGQSCADKWHSYQRSAACYSRFRIHHVVRPQATQTCGPPLKEPVDCPRPARPDMGARDAR